MLEACGIGKMVVVRELAVLFDLVDTTAGADLLFSVSNVQAEGFGAAYHSY